MNPPAFKSEMSKLASMSKEALRVRLSRAITGWEPRGYAHPDWRLVERTRLQGFTFKKDPRTFMRQLAHDLQQWGPRDVRPDRWNPSPGEMPIMLPLQARQGPAGRVLLAPSNEGGREIATFFHNEMSRNKGISLRDFLAREGRVGVSARDRLRPVMGRLEEDYSNLLTPYDDAAYDKFVIGLHDKWQDFIRRGERVHEPPWTARAREVLRREGRLPPDRRQGRR
jgi:hypothetical protein